MLGWLAANPLVYFAAFWGILISAAFVELASSIRLPRTETSPRLRVNFGFGLMTMVLFSLPLLTEVGLAQLAAANGWGLLNRFGLPLFWQVWLSFLIYDFCSYSIHRLAHHYPLLWRLHRVHHSDSDLDLSTFFRAHPLDVIVILAVRLALIAALGIHPAAVVLFGLAKQVTMALGHAAVAPRPRLSRLFGLLFVTPAWHATHHSAERAQTDSNYGEVLSIWDRLFGSVGQPSGTAIRFGLGDAYDADSASLMSQLKLPFIAK